MGQVVIRNIDDHIVERLKARAAADHKSLEQSLRELLAEAARPSRRELLDDLARIRAMTPPASGTFPTAEELIRAERDRR